MKYTIAILVVGLSLLAAGCTQNSTASTQAKQVATPTQSTTSSDKEKTYSMDEVKQANSKAKCWAAINGSVYDLTTFVGMHPGGQSRILAICGTDATTAFNKKHGHQAMVLKMMSRLKIGKLAS